MSEARLIKPIAFTALSGLQSSIGHVLGLSSVYAAFPSQLCSPTARCARFRALRSDPCPLFALLVIGKFCGELFEAVKSELWLVFGGCREDQRLSAFDSWFTFVVCLTVVFLSSFS